MRRFLFVPVAFGLLIACNGGDKATEAQKEEAAAVDDVTKNPVYQKGVELIAKSDCLTCHAIEDKINGPSYREVANKYAGLPDTVVSYLAGKIITGGSGVWGTIPMTPHPGLSQQDAEALARYVLLFKN